MSELLCSSEDGRNGVVLVFNPSHKKMSAFTVSRNILPGSFALPCDTPDHSDGLLEKPCVGTLSDSLCLAQPSSHLHQSASPVNITTLAPMGQPPHQMSITNWSTGGKIHITQWALPKFHIHKIVKNGGCFKPLSLR